jgi:hypothetical protein
MVSGRWYLVPDDVVERFPGLRRNTARVASAVRLSRET